MSGPKTKPATAEREAEVPIDSSAPAAEAAPSPPVEAPAPAPPPTGRLRVKHGRVVTEKGEHFAGSFVELSAADAERMLERGDVERA